MIYILLALFCGLPVSHLFLNKVDIWHAHGIYTQVVVAIGFFWSLLHYQRSKVQNVPLFCLLAWITIQSSHVFYQGIVSGKYNTNVAFAFVNVLSMALLYVLVTRKDQVSAVINCMKWVVLGTLAFSTLQAFELGQFYKLVDLGYTPTNFDKTFVVGFIGNPTILSCYLAMCLPFLFAFKPLTRYLSIVLLFIINGFYVNHGVDGVSATGLCVSVMTLLWCLWFYNRKAFYVLFSACVIGGIWFLAAHGVPSAEGRFGQWARFIPLVKKNFITGVGLGSVNAITHNSTQGWRLLHCEPFQLLIENGFIGLTLALWCVYDALRRPIFDEVIVKGVLMGFLLVSLTLFPAHLWAFSVIAVFCYSALYVR